MSFFLRLYFLISFLAAVQADCATKCRSQFYDARSQAAAEACLSQRSVFPAPVVYEMCQGVFLQTYHSVCMNFCDPAEPITAYDCPNIVRSAAISLKQGMKACKLGRDGATRWVADNYKYDEEDERRSMEEIQQQTKDPEPEPEPEPEPQAVIEKVEEVIEEIAEEIMEEVEEMVGETSDL